jgi:thiaminase/transcriptional activator TenA
MTDAADAPGSIGSVAAAIASEETLFGRLRARCGEDWHRYTRHDFVRDLGAGTLPDACFRQYLGQDYLFLIHFARAYALAAYKSDSLADMRQAARSMSAILDAEMGLHVKFCAAWGLSERDMAALPEATATLAYTRYVLETGLSGDLLDLYVALAPCVVGYAEIAGELMADPATRLDGNPYREWIEMYAGEEYQAVALDAVAQLDRLGAARGGEARFNRLAVTFREATRLETAFWDMGLSPTG